MVDKGELGESGQRYQLLVYKTSKYGGVTYSMTTIVNAVL